jgi:hypothetical protein
MLSFSSSELSHLAHSEHMSRSLPYSVYSEPSFWMLYVNGHFHHSRHTLTRFTCAGSHVWASYVSCLSCYIRIIRYSMLLSCFTVFPTAQYTLPKMFILPTVYYTAVALVSLVLIFPESLNHVWLYVVSPPMFPPISPYVSHHPTELPSVMISLP